MENHPIVAVIGFQHVGPFTLRIEFDDGASQTIDFSPILYGNIYGPLRDRSLFEQVSIDPDFETLVWPNGADFDPATLRYWPDELPGFLEAAEHWKQADSPIQS
jgi:Protein of unknown function (DUF2442)